MAKKNCGKQWKSVNSATTIWSEMMKQSVALRLTMELNQNKHKILNEYIPESLHQISCQSQATKVDKNKKCFQGLVQSIPPLTESSANALEMWLFCTKPYSLLRSKLYHVSNALEMSSIVLHLTHSSLPYRISFRKYENTFTFLSYLKTEMAHVVEILPYGRLEPVYAA